VPRGDILASSPIPYGGVLLDRAKNNVRVGVHFERFSLTVPLHKEAFAVCAVTLLRVCLYTGIHDESAGIHSFSVPPLTNASVLLYRHTQRFHLASVPL
jgi:hypothetical protein